MGISKEDIFTLLQKQRGDLAVFKPFMCDFLEFIGRKHEINEYSEGALTNWYVGGVGEDVAQKEFAAFLEVKIRDEILNLDLEASGLKMKSSTVLTATYESELENTMGKVLKAENNLALLEFLQKATVREESLSMDSTDPFEAIDPTIVIPTDIKEDLRLAKEKIETLQKEAEIIRKRGTHLSHSTLHPFTPVVRTLSMEEQLRRDQFKEQQRIAQEKRNEQRRLLDFICHTREGTHGCKIKLDKKERKMIERLNELVCSITSEAAYNRDYDYAPICQEIVETIFNGHHPVLKQAFTLQHFNTVHVPLGSEVTDGALLHKLQGFLTYEEDHLGSMKQKSSKAKAKELLGSFGRSQEVTPNLKVIASAIDSSGGALKRHFDRFFSEKEKTKLGLG